MARSPSTFAPPPWVFSAGSRLGPRRVTRLSLHHFRRILPDRAGVRTGLTSRSREKELCSASEATPRCGSAERPDADLLLDAALNVARDVERAAARAVGYEQKTDATLPGAPDSALARLAEEAAADQGPALAGHGYRTWVIGDALALHDGLPLDRELFYVASLLHDSGLLREVVGQDFTIRSARLVLDLCGQVETVDDATGLRLADAIVGHASPGLTVKDDEIAFYVQAGAMADLAGLRMWDLPRGYLAAAYAQHPACDEHRTVPALIRREARDVPEGRFAVLRSAGLDRMVQFSPARR